MARKSKQVTLLLATTLINGLICSQVEARNLDERCGKGEMNSEIILPTMMLDTGYKNIERDNYN